LKARREKIRMGGPKIRRKKEGLMDQKKGKKEGGTKVFGEPETNFWNGGTKKKNETPILSIKWGGRIFRKKEERIRKKE